MATWKPSEVKMMKAFGGILVLGGCMLSSAGERLARNILFHWDGHIEVEQCQAHISNYPFGLNPQPLSNPTQSNTQKNVMRKT